MRRRSSLILLGRDLVDEGRCCAVERFVSLSNGGIRHRSADAPRSKKTRGRPKHEIATVHAFRSSFRCWYADTGKPREAAVAALALAVGGVEDAYFRSDLLQCRRRLMDAWAAYLARTDPKVPVLHRRAGFPPCRARFTTTYSGQSLPSGTQHALALNSGRCQQTSQQTLKPWAGRP